MSAPKPLTLSRETLEESLTKGKPPFCPLCYVREPSEAVKMEKIKDTKNSFKCPSCGIQLTRGKKHE